LCADELMLFAIFCFRSVFEFFSVKFFEKSRAVKSGGCWMTPG
jgi:hypothetical protein